MSLRLRVSTENEMRPGRRFFGNLILAGGVLTLASAASHWATGWRAQAAGFQAGSPFSRSGTATLPDVAEGDAVGRLELPRLGLDVVVFEGTSEVTLRKGPGHLAGTGWPSSDTRPGNGNCVIAGHRDSFFRPLEGARRGDVVRWHGRSGVSTYKLEERRILRPRNLSSVAPTTDSRLTLITCYPFRWAGTAPYRLVWSAVPLEATVPAER
jgi:sortase A